MTTLPALTKSLQLRINRPRIALTATLAATSIVGAAVVFCSAITNTQPTAAESASETTRVNSTTPIGDPPPVAVDPTIAAHQPPVEVQPSQSGARNLPPNDPTDSDPTDSDSDDQASTSTTPAESGPQVPEKGNSSAADAKETPTPRARTSTEKKNSTTQGTSAAKAEAGDADLPNDGGDGKAGTNTNGDEGADKGPGDTPGANGGADGAGQTDSDNTSEVYFANCTEAWVAEAAPVLRGEPGYRPNLDGDNDGIACDIKPISLR